MECELCHKKEKSKTRCIHGHYVCNECHMQGIDSLVGLCMEETSKNPVVILNQMMRMPFCHMHGPEHHIMVGMALLTPSLHLRNPGRENVFQSCLRPVAFCQKPDSFHGGEYIPGQILWHSCRIRPAYDGFANYCQSFFGHHYQCGSRLSFVFSSGFLLINGSKTGSEAAHFSFRYTNPAVFDIIKKLSSTHFRRKTIHPETEIILLLKSI